MSDQELELESDHESNSISSSSGSDFSDKELGQLNDLCRELGHRVKGFKRQLEQLETRQM